MEENKMRLESTAFVLRNVMEESLDIVSYNAEQKGLELICDLSTEIPQTIVGDPVRLRKFYQRRTFF